MWRKSQKSLGKTEAIGQYGTNVASVFGWVRLRNPWSRRCHDEFPGYECRPHACNPLPPPPPPRGQAFSLHSSPWNSLRHLWHLDFWVWPTQELWQHCFHTVRKLPFSLMTSFSFSTLFPYCIAPAQHTFKYLTYTMIVGWTYFLFWYYIDVTTEIHIHVY